VFADMFSSKTFSDITDKKHDHYKKDWQKMYKIGV